MSMTMTAGRVRSTVTFCGAQAIVTGTGAGEGSAMLTSLSVAHHAVCRPAPSCPPGCTSSRFSVAVIEASAFRLSELFHDRSCRDGGPRAQTCSRKSALQIRCQRKIQGISSPQPPPDIHLPIKRTDQGLFWIKSKHLFVLVEWSE